MEQKERIRQKERPSQELIPQLPNAVFLMVKSDRGITHIVLDDYPNEEDRIKLLGDAIKKYGEENVRFCRVQHAKIQTVVTLVD